MSASAIIPGIPQWQKDAADANAAVVRKRRVENAAKKKKGAPWDERAFKRTCSWAISTVVYWNGFITGTWVMWLARNAPRYYPLAKSFLKAHAGLFVGWMTQVERKAVCDACPYRYDFQGREWCRGENDGQGCRCGHWPPANLKHKRRLAAFKCPQGKFGYGGLVKLVVRR